MIPLYVVMFVGWVGCLYESGVESLRHTMARTPANESTGNETDALSRPAQQEGTYG